MEDKKPWQSKTLWISVVVALLPLVPSVSQLVATNPELVSMCLGALFGVLRLVSKDKIVIS